MKKTREQKLLNILVEILRAEKQGDNERLFRACSAGFKLIDMEKLKEEEKNVRTVDSHTQP